MKINLVLSLSLLTGTACINEAAPSGATLNTTLRKETVSECECPALVLYGEVAPYYAYKVQSTTDLNRHQWVDEFSPITSVTTNMSWAMPLTSTGNKFFRIVELGYGPYVSISLDPSSPAGGTIHVSSVGETADVPMIIYDLKSHLTNSVLKNAMVILISTSTNNDIAATFSSVKLQVGSTAYAGKVVSTSGRSDYLGGSYGWKVEFSNLNISLLADTTVPVKINVDFPHNTNNSLNGLKIQPSDGGLQLLDIQDEGFKPLSIENDLTIGPLFDLLGN